MFFSIKKTPFLGFLNFVVWIELKQIKETWNCSYNSNRCIRYLL